MDYHRIYAKIDLNAAAENLRLARKKIPAETKLMLVVKADAYGHGAVMIAREFEDKADYFAVADMAEAMELRRGGIRKPILILGYTSPSLYAEALEYDITLTVFQPDRIRLLSEAACAKGKRVKVHFAIDTGMSRIGWDVSEKSADEAALAAKLPGIFVEGIFSHFATADGTDMVPSMKQRALYDRFVEMLEVRGVQIPIKHINNSAGILRFQRCYDMVRWGIGLYGLYPSEEVRAKSGDQFVLHPVMKLVSHIAHIKMLGPNHGISYGLTYVTDHTMKIATIPVGYGDGYPYALSGCGEVLIRGRRCPILGHICMDQMMVDITDIPEVEMEDPVVLIGHSGDECISAEELGSKAHSFNYELICGIARRVPRVYIRGNDPVCTVSYLGEK